MIESLTLGGMPPALRVQLEQAHSGILLVGITPPRRSATAAQADEIAAVTTAPTRS